MGTEIARWGNSLALRLPRPIADQAGIAEGTPVEIDIKGDQLVIRPALPRYSLDELLAGITPDNLPDESFDDAPRGRELL
ncbi:AbrB/MazE/SpoVT family DNA-binding domain-containing protein (plasmid) [Azospirillum sp. A26]|uniref:AbrB/MazE/SpoVT family DNA-binding domain-containing protein n=1 Tax=Azospirillum sp. A26 TaxID=3160607 RepID=UPI0036729A4B